MKKISLLLLLFTGIQLVSAQNFRKPYREAKRALKKKDYITATLKSAESLKAKNNFKKICFMNNQQYYPTLVPDDVLE